MPAAVCVSAALLLAFMPLLVSGGVRAWLWWLAREEGLALEVAHIDAPLFRPVVLHQLRFRSQANASAAAEIQVEKAELGLNLAALFGRSEARQIRELSIEGARVAIRKRTAAPPKESSPANWRPFEHFFADSFRVAHLEVRIEEGDTIIEAHDVSLTANETETGTISVRDLTVASPLVSKRFTGLRGATSWQNQRLTVAAITLTRGIDIDALTADFSHLALQRIGFELNVDVFGGKVRANVTTEARAGRAFWDVAGTATGISLAQMSEMLGWRTAATGAVRTCKFTFRGEPGDLIRSTSSIWAEVNALTWGPRAADTIMLGASVYNRRIHLEQLYVKQAANQLTVSGDSPLTMRADDWTRPGLNIDISADIKDLGQLTRLFGAAPKEYAGALEVDGTLTVEERKRSARLTASGEVQLNGARLFKAGRASGKLVCNGTTAVLEDGELTRDDAHLLGRAELDFGDLRQIRAHLFPAEGVIDATAVPTGACVSGLTLTPTASGTAAGATINELELHGGLFARDWSISLIDNGGAPEQRVARTFQICPATTTAGEVRLGAAGTISR